MDAGSDLNKVPPNKLNSLQKCLLLALILSIIPLFCLFLNSNSERLFTKIKIIYPSWKRNRTIAKYDFTEVTSSSLNLPHSTIKSSPPLPRVCALQEKWGPLVQVGDIRTYVVSPYMEHRTEEKRIHTITIMLRSEEATYSCLLCCDGKNVSSAATYSIHSDHFDFEYGTADITCPIPTSCVTPTHVAIYQATLGEDYSSVKKLHYLPIMNQHAYSQPFPYEFTVCISTMYDYDNVLQLVQAMEMFRLLGIQRVAIYKISCYPATQRILDYYVRSGFLEIIPWPITSYINVSKGWQKAVSPGDLHYFGQIPAINDCVYRYMYQSRYVALQDMDELILPLSVESWRDLLPQLEMAYGPDVGFEFENNVFPITITEQNVEFGYKEWQHVHGVNILQHIYREPNDPHKFNNFKVIVNPRVVFSATVHGLLKSERGSVRVDASIARMYHVRKPGRLGLSNDEHIRDERLLHYAPKLISAVSEVLKATLQI